MIAWNCNSLRAAVTVAGSATGDGVTLLAHLSAQVVDLLDELGVFVHHVQVVLSVDLVLLFQALLQRVVRGLEVLLLVRVLLLDVGVVVEKSGRLNVEFKGSKYFYNKEALKAARGKKSVGAAQKPADVMEALDDLGVVVGTS